MPIVVVSPAGFRREQYNRESGVEGEPESYPTRTFGKA
jgi:hypothetical protein